MVDIVSRMLSLPDMSILLSLWDRAEMTFNIVKRTSMTVFAPTNAAFAALPPTVLEFFQTQATQSTLESLLFYHMLNDDVLDAELTNGMLQTLEGSDVTIITTIRGGNNADARVVSVADGGINTAELQRADIMTTNGILHMINAVLFPPDLVSKVRSLTKVDDMASLIATRSDLSTFMALLTTAGLVDTLRVPGYTVVPDIDCGTREVLEMRSYG